MIFKVTYSTHYLAVSKANFSYHFCIGKGGFGKVWKVHRKKNHLPFAMKEMSKARIITKRSVKSVINER
jgi:serine/threonine kinase 32